MKLDDKIRNRRIAYFLNREASTAFELALLYCVLAKRRTADDKIADACLKSIQWMKNAEFKIPDNIKQLKPADQLELIEKVLVNNSVGARHPDFNRDFVLRSSS